MQNRTVYTTLHNEPRNLSSTKKIKNDARPLAEVADKLLETIPDSILKKKNAREKMKFASAKLPSQITENIHYRMSWKDDFLKIDFLDAALADCVLPVQRVAALVDSSRIAEVRATPDGRHVESIIPNSTKASYCNMNMGTKEETKYSDKVQESVDSDIIFPKEPVSIDGNEYGWHCHQNRSIPAASLLSTVHDNFLHHNGDQEVENNLTSFASPSVEDTEYNEEGGFSSCLADVVSDDVGALLEIPVYSNEVCWGTGVGTKEPPLEAPIPPGMGRRIPSFSSLSSSELNWNENHEQGLV